MCRQSCDKTTMEPCLQNHSIPAYQGASRWSQTTSNKKSHREYIECLGEDCKGKTHNELRSCRALCLKEYQSKLKKSQGDLMNWVACHRTVQVCKGKCRSEKVSRKLRCKSCKADCNARYEQLRKSIMGVSHDQTVRPARWCKRLSPIKQCLHPNISVGANNGWKNCPEQYRVTIPNHGQGRHTIIQNTERWTTWRGLTKRIMVLPSDWSWLGKPETKKLFQHYGTNEKDWKVNFGIAWNKISRVGWEPHLAKCRKVSCSVSSKSITCPAGWSSIEFPLENCSPRPHLHLSAKCELVGGYGLKAKLQCEMWSGLCTSAGASAAGAEILQESAGGGKTPKCA